MYSNEEASTVDGVIVISAAERPPEYIIRKILNVENLSNPCVYKGINGYKWKVDTKYYIATVNLYAVSEKTEFDSEFSDKIQATVFYFNGEKSSGFENVLNWMPLLKNISSEVQLLVCESCDTDETRKDILNWCVQNQYEFIELDQTEETDDEDDGLFSKSKGFERVVEALQAHTWSNLVMKEDIKCKKETKKEESDAKSDLAASCTVPKETTDASRKMKVGDEELLLEERFLERLIEQDDPEMASFEALFSKFGSMKEKAAGLTGEARKKYAEEVAIAFWKAMGGDADEIAGLDDDD